MISQLVVCHKVCFSLVCSYNQKHFLIVIECHLKVFVFLEYRSFIKNISEPELSDTNRNSNFLIVPKFLECKRFPSLVEQLKTHLFDMSLASIR